MTFFFHYTALVLSLIIIQVTSAAPIDQLTSLLDDVKELIDELVGSIHKKLSCIMNPELWRKVTSFKWI